MNRYQLTRQDHNAPDFSLLYRDRDFLNAFLDRDPDAADPGWRNAFADIVAFQDRDGSFKLLDTYKIESDARVDFCHMPTYLATAIIMKAFLADRDLLERREESILAPALERCCARELSGHGYEDLSGQIEAMRVFLRAGVQAFVHRYPKLCPKFTLMIYSIVDTYRRYIEEERFVFGWGENHETDFREIVGFFPEGYLIFVYGTLMKGQRYHGRYLSPLEPLGVGVLSGYRMFDIGSFPGIVPGKGKVKGEIYRVNARQLAAIDHLEDEGDLYVRTTVKVTTAPLCYVDAYTYVYNQALNGKEEIPMDKQPYSESPLVWYVAYGSNLLEARLMYYIAGGRCEKNDKDYPSCRDTTPPRRSRPVVIPHPMYYGNYGLGSWKDSAVCFLDDTKAGKAYGRAYLITKEQLEEIQVKEGKTPKWYGKLVSLEPIEGIPAYTFTSEAPRRRESFKCVSCNYGKVLRQGMKETYPEMSDTEIDGYLKGCGE